MTEEKLFHQIVSLCGRLLGSDRSVPAVLSQQNMFELLGLNFHNNGVFAVEGLAVGWSMVLVGSDSRFPVQGVRQSKAGHFAQNLSKHRTQALDKGH